MPRTCRPPPVRNRAVPRQRAPNTPRRGSQRTRPQPVQPAIEPDRRLRPEVPLEDLAVIADALDRDTDRLLRAEIADTGKPVALAQGLDIPRGAANFRVFIDMVKAAHEASYRTSTPDGRGALNYTLRRPKGVVAVICPWNLPFLNVTWKLGPALATIRESGARLNLNLLGEAVLGEKEAHRRLDGIHDLLAVEPRIFEIGKLVSEFIHHVVVGQVAVVFEVLVELGAGERMGDRNLDGFGVEALGEGGADA